ncbi:MAG: FHA domain-containing protein [bacterium]|nr:FHA domain-containing protein [bacterium]
MPQTRALRDPQSGLVPDSVPEARHTDAQHTPAGATDHARETIAWSPDRTAHGTDPVVGWLVCVDGPERGRDFRLHAERNFSGRAAKMDVCLAADEAISRNAHLIVTFDPRTAAFAVVPGEVRGMVYINGSPLATVVALADRDIIELGNTKLLFVALCTGGFTWA